ncbi:MAG: HPr kinase/phosphorylase, partial [Clostridia bacterium]|nr:HPr kinase/phosphorylase [Clostridia bacterium]
MVTQQAFAKALDLEVIHPAQKRSMQIEVADVCRPGIQFAGYFEVFAHARPQVIGKTEMAYLMSLPEDICSARLERYFSYDIPCIVIARGMDCPQVLLDQAKAHGVPIY